jgi:hypothetical protein
MTDRFGQGVRLPDPPRAIPKWFFMRRMRAMFAGGVVFTALGLGLGAGIILAVTLLGGGVWPGADLALDRHHEVTTATLLAKEVVRHVHVNSKHPWKLRFRFMSGSGREVEAVGFTYDSSFADKQPGETLDVEFDPAEPGVARPVGGSVAVVDLWVYWLILGLVAPEFGIGVTLLMVVWRLARAERALLAYGSGAEAEITRVERLSHIRFNRQNPHDVYYQFTDHGGRRVAGRDRTYHYAWAEGLKVGDRVGVVYNPHVPAANVLWLHGGESG